jgi:hypothetical protein
MPLMGLTIEKPSPLLLPAVEEANSGTQAVEGNTNGIIPIPTIATPKTNPEQHIKARKLSKTDKISVGEY